MALGDYLNWTPQSSGGSPSLMSMITQPNLQTPVPAQGMPPTAIPMGVNGNGVPPQQMQAPPGMSVPQAAGQPQGGVAAGPQGITVPNHSLTGILGIHGVPGALINWLGDTVATAAGMHLPFADDPTLRARAAAMQGFATNPMAAVQALSNTGDTTGAMQARQQMIQQQFQQAQMQREALAAQDTHNEAVQKQQDTLRTQYGNLAASSNPQTYGGIYDMINKSAQQRGVDISNLNLPDPTKVDETQKDWDPETKTQLQAAASFNTPLYRMQNSASSNEAANARMLMAQTGASGLPSLVNLRNSQAGAAPVNAAAHATQAGAAASQASTARDRLNSQTGANGAPPIQKPSGRARPSGGSNGLGTISRAALPPGTQTFNGGKIARIGNNYVNIQ